MHRAVGLKPWFEHDLGAVILFLLKNLVSMSGIIKTHAVTDHKRWVNLQSMVNLRWRRPRRQRHVPGVTDLHWSLYEYGKTHNGGTVERRSREGNAARHY